LQVFHLWKLGGNGNKTKEKVKGGLLERWKGKGEGGAKRRDKKE
jgi:hypothetical protein